MAPASIRLGFEIGAKTLLQISDCHLVTAGSRLLDVDTQQTLEAVLDQACAQRAIDAVIATGDLAHDPQPLVYERFLATVQRFYSGPLMCLPGNHDVLAAMQSAGLPMAPLALDDWLVVGLDSHIDDEPSARVDDGDRDAVAQAFAAHSQLYILLATHHPLLDVDCPWLDKDRIQNPVELLEWLTDRSAVAEQPRLRGVVFGHAHQPVEDRVAHLPVYGAPSTCFQFLPRAQQFALDELPPGYRWLTLSPDGQIQAQVEYVDQ